MTDGRVNHVFGPVPSRRLGRSLGIDPIPLKTCNWNCVYCQLGRTLPLNNERQEYVPAQEILEDVRLALQLHAGTIDWVTFVGSGEPTLHIRLGELIRSVKTMTALPVAVITNGALLYRQEVRKELAAADAVLPTLDAGNARLYRRINRPHPAITHERLVDGLIAFRKHYRGKLWVEVMLVRDLNDGEAALHEIAAVLATVRPDEVHITLPTRPPVEVWVQPADAEGLRRAVSILGSVAHVVRPAVGEFSASGCNDAAEAVLNIIGRHPMRDDEVHDMLKRSAPEHVDEIISELRSSGRAQTVVRNGITFWTAAPARFPVEENSWRTAPEATSREGKTPG